MKKGQLVLLLAVLAMIGLAAGFLQHVRANQKLGEPGVRTQPLPDQAPGTIKSQVILPENVLDYESEPLPVDKVVLGYLPQDTSFGQRLYRAPGSDIMVNVVLMGTDRTSLHKPQFCLSGQGWAIDEILSSVVTIPIEKPVPYELPVMKLITSKQFEIDGKQVPGRGIYVYWFVSKSGYTAEHWQRMWWMAKDILRTGVMQRWAYVTCFSVCSPGQEEATFERMKKFIAASVPQFQLTPGSAGTSGEPNN
jgi:hypothetical protein